MMARNSQHILLVEDDDDHAEIVARGLILASIECKLHRVSDGEMALDYLFRRGSYSDTALSPRPGLILLDLRLPKVDGSEVLRTIRQTPPLSRLPIVILTTSTAERDIRSSYDLHANSYLLKPPAFTELAEMLKSLGFYWLQLNVNPSDPRTGSDTPEVVAP